MFFVMQTLWLKTVALPCDRYIMLGLKPSKSINNWGSRKTAFLVLLRLVNSQRGLGLSQIFKHVDA